MRLKNQFEEVGDPFDEVSNQFDEVGEGDVEVREGVEMCARCPPFKGQARVDT